MKGKQFLVLMKGMQFLVLKKGKKFHGSYEG